MKSASFVKIGKATFTLIITLGLLFLTGCSSQTVATVQPTQISQPTATNPPVASTPDKVVIWARGDNANIKDWKQDRVIMAIEKATNTDIEVVTVPWDSFVDRLNASLATGVVPDIIGILNQRDDRNLIEKMAQDGVIAPYEGEVATAAPNILARYSTDPSLVEVKINNKIYMDPIIWGNKVVPDFGAIYVRQDILDKLKLNAPETFDDYFAYLKACMKDSGSQGVLLENSIDQSMSSFLGAYGLPWTGWAKKPDNTYGYWAVQPGVKDALLLFRTMVADGLVDPIFWEKGPNDDDVTGRYASGADCSIIMNGGGNISWLQKSSNLAGKGVRNLLLPALRANSDLRGYTAQPMWESVALIGNLKGNNPVAAARILNYAASDEGAVLLQYGVEGIDWQKTNGKVEPLPARATEGGFPTDLKSLSSHRIAQDIGYWSVPALRPYIQAYGEGDAFAAWNNQMTENQRKYTIQSYGFNATSDLWTKFQPTSTELMTRAFTEIVKSSSDADAAAKFDQFVKDWMSQGGQDAATQMNTVLSAIYK
jgi:putative aldouronate transport system substrate-binding protein